VSHVVCQASWKTAYEHFADEVARSEADDESDDHACKDRHNCLMDRSYSVHLEVIRGKQGED